VVRAGASVPTVGRKQAGAKQLINVTGAAAYSLCARSLARPCATVFSPPSLSGRLNVA